VRWCCSRFVITTTYRENGDEMMMAWSSRELRKKSPGPVSWHVDLGHPCKQLRKKGRERG
jgi:hypothetical protein